MSADLCPVCGRALVPLCRLCNVVADSNLRTIVDVLDDNWMEVCKSLGCVHEQSMGFALPGTSTEVLAAIERLRESLRRADRRELDALAELDDAICDRDHWKARAESLERGEP